MAQRRLYGASSCRPRDPRHADHRSVRRGHERRQAARGMRRVRHLGRRQCRGLRRARPPRAPAPRPGSGRHHQLRRPAISTPTARWAMSPAISTATTSSAASPGRAAIGHVRYSTTGETALRNVQPLFAELADGGFAVAHNGNISNAMKLRRDAQPARLDLPVDQRHRGRSSTSSRPASYPTMLDRLIDALKQVEGAYSLLVPDRAGHDRLPRPARHPPAGHGQARRGDYLRLGNGRARRHRRDLSARGRAGRADRRQRQRHPLVPPVRDRSSRGRASSSMSISRGPTASSRASRSMKCARRSAPSWRARPRSRPIMSCRCPTAACPRRSASARQAGSRSSSGSSARHYVGRTFIQPSQEVRHLGVKLKHNANSALVAGKKIVLIDDSIVRGTTSVKIVQMMRDAGAREVHMRIASPPTTHSCFYGVDTPERAKLLAAQMNVAEMADYINADSLAFISIDGLYRALGEEPRRRRAAALRRLLHRRLSDPADRRHGEATAERSLSLVAQSLEHVAMTDGFEAARRQARARHRRQPRHRRGDRRGAGRRRRACHPDRAQRARGSRRSRSGSTPPAAARRSRRWTSPTARASASSRRRWPSAGASSTSWCSTPRCSAR